MLMVLGSNLPFRLVLFSAVKCVVLFSLSTVFFVGATKCDIQQTILTIFTVILHTQPSSRTFGLIKCNL